VEARKANARSFIASVGWLCGAVVSIPGLDAGSGLGVQMRFVWAHAREVRLNAKPVFGFADHDLTRAALSTCGRQKRNFLSVISISDQR